MLKNMKLIFWAWVGAALTIPLLYPIQRYLGEMAHGPALALSIGLAVMTGAICTWIILSSHQNR